MLSKQDSADSYESKDESESRNSAKYEEKGNRGRRNRIEESDEEVIGSPGSKNADNKATAEAAPTGGRGRRRRQEEAPKPDEQVGAPKTGGGWMDMQPAKPAQSASKDASGDDEVGGFRDDGPMYVKSEVFSSICC